MAGIPIEKFDGFKAKMYSITYGGCEKKTANGMCNQKRMRQPYYKNCIMTKTVITASM